VPHLAICIYSCHYHIPQFFILVWANIPPHLICIFPCRLIYISHSFPCRLRCGLLSDASRSALLLCPPSHLSLPPRHFCTISAATFCSCLVLQLHPALQVHLRIFVRFLRVSYPSCSPSPATVRSRDDMTTANAIKDKAKEDAHRIARGATSKALLSVARTQTTKSREAELAGDLRSALACATKAACLITMFMESSEYEAEQKQLGQKGPLHQALIEFHQVCDLTVCSDRCNFFALTPESVQHEGSDLIERMQSIDSKLTQMEQKCVQRFHIFLSQPFDSAH
jgi:hypothetical protein